MAGNVDLTLRLLFEDKVSAGLNKLSGKLAMALSIGAVTAFGVASVKAFAEAEAAQNKLSFAFGKFPAMSNISLGALRAFNDEMMKKTGVDNDAIAAGQAVLAQFKLTGQQVKDITPLLIDYALATGKELPAAAETLGKASMGNTRALKELGISYKATGDQAQDFANITALIGDKVGGFAEQEVATAAGQLRRLETAYGEVQESVGAALAPALVNAADAMVAMTEELGPMMDDLTQLTQLASDAGSALMTVADAGRELPGAMDVGLLDSFGMGMGQFVTGLLHADDAIDQLEADLAAQGYTLDRNTGAITKTGEAAEATARHFGVMGDAAKTSANAVKQLDAALQRIGGRNISIAEATSQLQESFDAAAEAAKKNGKTLSLQTAAGRENRAALIQIAKAADEAASAYAQNGKSASYVKARTQEARAAFIQAAQQMGATKDEARNLATEYGLIPKKVTTAVTASGIESVLSAASILKQRWQEIINLPTAVLYAHYQVSGTPPSNSSSSTGTHRLVFRGGAQPLTLSALNSLLGVPTYNWRAGAGGDSISSIVSGTHWKNLEAQIRKARKALNAAESDEDKKAAKKKLHDLQKELEDRRKALKESLKSQRDDARAEALAAGQAWLEQLKSDLDAAKAAEQSALDTLNGLLEQRQSFKDAIAESIRGQAGGATFQFADTDAAAQAQKDAQAELFDARRAYNNALGTTDEAAALERLNAAKKAAAEADKAAADARAMNTPAGVLAAMNKKLASVRSLATNLQRMRDMGYPVEILRDVLAQGIDGAQLAEVLASADPGIVSGFQSAQAELNSLSTGLGQFGYDISAGAGALDQQISDAQGVYSAAQKTAAQAQANYDAYIGADGRPLRPIRVSVQIDGRQIVQVLQDYRRSTGGAGLGLG